MLAPSSAGPHGVYHDSPESAAWSVTSGRMAILSLSYVTLWSLSLLLAICSPVSSQQAFSKLLEWIHQELSHVFATRIAPPESLR